MSGHQHDEETVRIVAANGADQIFNRCKTCYQRTTEFLPHNQYDDIETIPIIVDYRTDQPCARCGQQRHGVELHHWAPKAIFDKPEEWPTDYLCVACHNEWHQTMTPTR